MSKTFDVRGQKVRSQSNRRYIVVAVRPQPVHTAQGVYVPFAHIEKRSDNLTVAYKAAAKYGFARGALAVVIDSKTGQEV